MAMFRRPFEAVELDSPTVFEMPASQPVELECPDATEPPGLSVSSNRQPSGMQTDLNEMGSWSNICDMPAELPELHPPSYGSFAQGPEVVKEPVEKPALYLGGADDFQGSAASGSFQPFFHSTQRATPGPERAVEPLSTCYPRSITFPDTLLTNAITSPTPTYQTPSGYLIRERSPRLPILKLNTVNIQGKYLSPASSRRPSVQSGTSGGRTSQFSCATALSRADSSPWSLTQASTATPQSSNPSSGMRSSSQSFHYAAAHWSPDYLQPYSHSNGVFSPDVDLSSAMPKTPASLLVPAFPRDKMRFNDASPAAASPAAANAPNNFLDSFVQADEWEFLFADPSAHATTAAPGPVFFVPKPLQPRPPQLSAPSVTLKPPKPQNNPPQQHQEPAQTISGGTVPKDVCERCGFHFKSKPRDLLRNKGRHLKISCPFRDRDPEHVACSSPGCLKTFARDCARRVHEKKQHGIEVQRSKEPGLRRGGVRKVRSER